MQDTAKVGKNVSITPSLMKFIELIFNDGKGKKERQTICEAILRNLPIAVAGGTQRELVESLNLKNRSQYWRTRKYMFKIGLLKKESREIFVYGKNVQRKYIVLDRGFLHFLRLTIDSFSKMPLSTK